MRGKTWSRGTNSRLPFGVNVNLNLSIIFSLPKTENVRDVCLDWIVCIRSLSPSSHPRSDHAPIVIVTQSEHLKHSISPRNQSAKHPDSGCFGISGVVIGSALSNRWRSGPEAFRAGHFLRGPDCKYRESADSCKIS